VTDVDILLQLNGVASTSGFGTSFGQGTVVSTDVTNQGAAAISVAAAVTQNDNAVATGLFSLQALNGVGTGASIIVNNLAPSATILSTATGNFSLTTTQTGAAGANSLTVDLNAASTINTLTTTGDGLLVVANGTAGGAVAITAVVDPSNSLTNINITDVNAGSTTTIGGVSDTALVAINATNATGNVILGNTAALSQSNLVVTDGSAALAGSHLTITTTGNNDTFTIGTATANNNFNNVVSDSGAAAIITIDGTGANTVTANGAGNTITVGDAAHAIGANAITATGGGDTITFLGTGAGGGTAHVGSNAIVSFGTATASNSENIFVTGDTAGAISSGAFNFTTLNNVTDGVGQQVTFATVAAEGLAGASVEASLVNVASATTLGQALDLAASLAATAVQPNQNLPNFAQIAGGHGVIDWFQFQGNTYVVEAVNSTGAFASHTALATGDVIVKIAGLVDLGAAATFAGNTLTL
jgi:hypothetical protein